MSLRLSELDTIPATRFGELLQQARTRVGVSRAELAHQAHVPVVVVRAWEHGTARPDDAEMNGVAAALGLRLDELIPARQQVPLGGGTAQEQIESFVRLIVTMRKTKAGTTPRFRLGDLEALATALGTDCDDVEKRIAQITACSKNEAKMLRRQLIRRRLLTPVAAGAFAAALMGVGGSVAHAATPAATSISASSVSTVSATSSHHVTPAESAKRQLAEAKAQARAAKAEAKKAKAATRKAQAAAAHATTVATQAQRELAEARAEIARLKLSAAQSATESAQKDATIAAKDATISGLAEQVSNLKGRVATLDREGVIKDGTISVLSGQLSSANDQIAGLQGDLASANAKIAELQRRGDRDRSENEHRGKEMADLKSEVGRLHDSSDEKDRQIRDLASAQKAVEQKDREIGDLNSKLTKAIGALLDAQNESQNARDDARDARDEAQDARDARDEATKDKAALEKQVSELQNKVSASRGDDNAPSSKGKSGNGSSDKGSNDDKSGDRGSDKSSGGDKVKGANSDPRSS